MELILVRHGQTYANLNSALDTAIPGMKLTSKGDAQAASLPQRWEKLGMPKPDLVVTSALIRTQQTARPLLAHFDCPSFCLPWGKEISAGEYEMNADTDSIIEYLWTINQWMEGNYSIRLGGDEDGQMVLERFDRLVDFCAQEVGPDGVAVIVTHGAMIRYWCNCRVPEVSQHFAAISPLPNTATCWFSGQPGQPARAAEYDTEGNLIRPAFSGEMGDWQVKHWADAKITDFPVPENIRGKELTREVLRQMIIESDYYSPEDQPRL